MFYNTISVALSVHRPFCNNTYSDNPQTTRHPLLRNSTGMRREASDIVSCRRVVHGNRVATRVLHTGAVNAYAHNPLYIVMYTCACACNTEGGLTALPCRASFVLTYIHTHTFV